MEPQQNSFEGWAVVELFGHQREAGYVVTQHFGVAALFRIDVPALPERDFELKSPQYVKHEWCGAGTKVRREASPARSRLVGPGAIYAINPCTEEAAREAIEALYGRELIVLDRPKVAALPVDVDEGDDEDEEEVPVR